MTSNNNKNSRQKSSFLIHVSKTANAHKACKFRNATTSVFNSTYRHRSTHSNTLACSFVSNASHANFKLSVLYQFISRILNKTAYIILSIPARKIQITHNSLHYILSHYNFPTHLTKNKIFNASFFKGTHSNKVILSLSSIKQSLQKKRRYKKRQQPLLFHVK